jgi:hypothetical protein
MIEHQAPLPFRVFFLLQEGGNRAPPHVEAEVLGRAGLDEPPLERGADRWA